MWGPCQSTCLRRRRGGGTGRDWEGWKGRGGDGGSADPARAGIRVGLIGPDSPTRDFHCSSSPPASQKASPACTTSSKEWPIERRSPPLRWGPCCVSPHWNATECTCLQRAAAEIHDDKVRDSSPSVWLHRADATADYSCTVIQSPSKPEQGTCRPRVMARRPGKLLRRGYTGPAVRLAGHQGNRAGTAGHSHAEPCSASSKAQIRGDRERCECGSTHTPSSDTFAHRDPPLSTDGRQILPTSLPCHALDGHTVQVLLASILSSARPHYFASSPMPNVCSCTCSPKARAKTSRDGPHIIVMTLPVWTGLVALDLDLNLSSRRASLPHDHRLAVGRSYLRLPALAQMSRPVTPLAVEIRES